MVGRWLMGEAMPQESNRITLKRDGFGLRVPNVHFNDHQNYLGCANTHTPRAGRSTTTRRDAHVPGPRHIPLVTTSIPLACARGRRTGIGNEFGRAPDVPNLFVSDGSVMNTEAAANAALTVVAPGRPHRGAADGERSPRTGPTGWFARADE